MLKSSFGARFAAATIQTSVSFARFSLTWRLPICRRSGIDSRQIAPLARLLPFRSGKRGNKTSSYDTPWQNTGSIRPIKILAANGLSFAVNLKTILSVACSATSKPSKKQRKIFIPPLFERLHAWLGMAIVFAVWLAIPTAICIAILGAVLHRDLWGTITPPAGSVFVAAWVIYLLMGCLGPLIRRLKASRHVTPNT